MSHLRRVATVTSGIVAALVAVTLVAGPARAAGEVQVEINGLSGSMRAGGFSFDDFTARFTNVSDQAVTGVFSVITVSLPGAPGDAIHVQKMPGFDMPNEDVGGGTVVFTDDAPFDLGRGNQGRREIRYFLSFGGNAPEGEAQVTVEAYANGQFLGSASTSTSVQGGAGPTSTGPPNTDPGVLPSLEAGRTYSVAPLPVGEENLPTSGSVPKSIYVLGSALVAVGVITIFLIFFPPGRRLRRSGAPGAAPTWPHPGSREEPEYARGQYGGQYGGQHGGPLAGTGPQQWPVVRGGGPAGGGPVAPRRPAPGMGDPGPHTGTGRALRDPAAEENLPPWLRG